MDKVIGRFDWNSERTSKQECRVSAKEKRDTHNIHIDVYEDGKFKRNSAIFTPEQLPQLIQALQDSQKAVQSDVKD